jgi:acyl-CoA dehydrogenase family protein 11
MTVVPDLTDDSERDQGFPSSDDIMMMYATMTMRPHPLPHWTFFLALSYFRMASIAQGVYARGIQGNASSSIALFYKNLVQPLAGAGCALIRTVKNTPPVLDFVGYSQRAKVTLSKLKEFMREHVYPAEPALYAHAIDPDQQWVVPPIMEELKKNAQEWGLWNLFLPGLSGFSQLEYAPMAEEMGRCPFASEVFNCSAPDTGNMEVLYLYGNEEQKREWLQPLLEGKIRSCFGMTGKSPP